MFGAIEIGGTSAKGIVVQTRLGTPIANEQAPEPDYQALRIADKLEKDHTGWRRRKPPCGVYNCAGHVWTSRRTSIYDSKHYDTILREDDYRRMEVGEAIELGDLTVYRLIGSDTILHIAMIIEDRPGLGSLSNIRVLYALSKWNAFCGEYTHRLEDVPFQSQFLRSEYDLEHWTDRPVPHAAVR
jgi:hypothetical protein